MFETEWCVRVVTFRRHSHILCTHTHAHTRAHTHTHIHTVQHFISYIGELPVVIMEYVEGGSLRGLLDKVKRSPALASRVLFLSYGKQIADGMMYLVCAIDPPHSDSMTIPIIMYVQYMYISSTVHNTCVSLY